MQKGWRDVVPTIFTKCESSFSKLHYSLASLVLTLVFYSVYSWQGVHAQVILRQWGIKGVSGNSQFQFPFAVSVNPFTGSVYVVDVGNNRIQKFTNSGTFIRSWGTYCVISTGIGCIDEDAARATWFRRWSI